MTSARTYKKDVETFKTLTNYPDAQIILQLRLNMDMDLKRVIDANYTDWETFTLNEALDSIEHIVKETSNPAVYRKLFQETNQLKDEPFQTFYTKLRGLSVDCSFTCPFDAQHDLTDYEISNRILSGVYDETLQQEILSKHETFQSVEDLVKYCENYEATKRDTVKLKNNSTSNTEINNIEDGLTHEEIVAALSLYKRNKKQSAGRTVENDACGQCGYTKHAKGVPCPAKEKHCLKCGRKGHFATVCRSRPQKSKEEHVSGAVLCSAVTASKLPQLPVTVGEKFLHENQESSVIADTGAQGTVAGTIFLEIFKIKLSWLNPPENNLRHVAGGVIETVGSCYLSFTLKNKKTTIQKVYFVSGIQHIFLSLGGCKDLCLVPRNFPFATVKDDVVDTTEQEEPSSEGGQPGVQEELVSSVVVTNPVISEPKELPFPETEENIPKLEQWLRDTFHKVFDTEQDPLPVMNGEPLHIHVSKDAVPHANYSPIPVPVHWKEAVKDLLTRYVSQGIIEKVPVGEAPKWIAKMLVVGKKESSTPRIVVDFNKLNQVCMRESYPHQYPLDLVSSVPACSYKTVADAYHGYFQVVLDEESRALTGFISECGVYRFLRAPQGLISSGDGYSSRYGEILADIERLRRIIDDTLLHDHSIKDAFYHTFRFLSTCSTNNVTLNPKKFKFCRKKLDFAGYTLDWDKFYPCSDIVAAIADFPMPESPTISDMRSWFGLVNQTTPFFASSKVMEPFRELLKTPKNKDKTVYWDDNLKSLFNESKKVICAEIQKGLAYFDPKKNIIVITDWCKIGIAFSIWQKHCTCAETHNFHCCASGWKLAMCSSRFLDEAEKNYAPIEGEALAIVWCLKKAKNFLLGADHFKILTDQKPLISTLKKDRSLASVENLRLRRMKEKTLGYRFEIEHIAGKKNSFTDTLSRYPVSNVDSDDRELIDELSICSNLIVSSCGDHIGVDLADLRSVAGSDQEYQTLLQKVSSDSFATSKSLEDPLIKPYHAVRDRISIVDGILMYCFEDGHLRVIVPRGQRASVLNTLHAAHQGPDGMLRRARQSVYWPGLDNDVQRVYSQCKHCTENAPSNTKEELILSPIPEFPFQNTVSDIFSLSGHHYLIYADRLTGWTELFYFNKDPTSSMIIKHLRDVFHRFGVPMEMSFDGGRNISSSEMDSFYTKWGVTQRKSSAYYPKSNGRAEAGVKSMKRAIRGNVGSDGSLDTDKVAAALLQYRNTPLKNINLSPAQLLLGRSLRDSVPQPSTAYKVSSRWEAQLRARERSIAKENIDSKVYHDRQPTKNYNNLTSGQVVSCQNVRNRKWDRTGEIVKALPFRQYQVKMHGSGRLSLRNRLHLKPLLHVKSLSPGQRGSAHSEPQPPASSTLPPPPPPRSPPRLPP